MSSMAKQEARRAGRPPLAMAEPFDDTPENIAKSVLSTPAQKRDEWRFMQARNRIWRHADDEGGGSK